MASNSCQPGERLFIFSLDHFDEDEDEDDGVNGELAEPLAELLGNPLNMSLEKSLEKPLVELLGNPLKKSLEKPLEKPLEEDGLKNGSENGSSIRRRVFQEEGRLLLDAHDGSVRVLCRRLKEETIQAMKPTESKSATAPPTALPVSDVVFPAKTLES